MVDAVTATIIVAGIAAVGVATGAGFTALSNYWVAQNNAQINLLLAQIQAETAANAASVAIQAAEIAADATLNAAMINARSHQIVALQVANINALSHQKTADLVFFGVIVTTMGSILTAIMSNIKFDGGKEADSLLYPGHINFSSFLNTDFFYHATKEEKLSSIDDTELFYHDMVYEAPLIMENNYCLSNESLSLA